MEGKMASQHSIYIKRVTRERNKDVEEAVKAVAGILKKPARSREEIDYLTAMVADKLAGKVLCQLSQKLAEQDESLSHE